MVKGEEEDPEHLGHQTSKSGQGDRSFDKEQTWLEDHCTQPSSTGRNLMMMMMISL